MRIADAALDAAIAYCITNGTRLHFCSAEPADAAGIAAVTLGNQATITLAAASDAAGGGRETVCPAFTDNIGTGDGLATHWAICNGATATILVSAGALAASFTVENGVDFRSPAFSAARFADAISIP